MIERGEPGAITAQALVPRRVLWCFQGSERDAGFTRLEVGWVASMPAAFCLRPWAIASEIETISEGFVYRPRPGGICRENV